MKKGIPCTHLRTISPDIDRITYRFVTDDGNTPAECTVCLGSEDPLTGERLTDIAFSGTTPGWKTGRHTTT